MCSSHQPEEGADSTIFDTPFDTCGMVFSTRPFSSFGEQRNCTLRAGHDGEHDADKEIVSPFVRQARKRQLPAKVYYGN